MKRHEEKQPWVLFPASPLGWESHYQIMPVSLRAWKQLGARIERIWFPRPTIDPSWVSELTQKCSMLIFPLGMPHYDALWLLRQLRAKYNVNIPACMTVASDFGKGEAYLIQYKDILRESDRFVFHSHVERELFRLNLNIEARGAVIPMAVDENLFRPVSKEVRMTFKKNLGLKSHEHLIVYAGRISCQKNVHALLMAFRLVLSNKPHSKLYILGSSDEIAVPHFGLRLEHRYMHLLSSMIVELGLKDSVVFTGPKEQGQLADFLSACDVHASLTVHSGECFGYSMAQGLAAGAPTVISNWGGGLDFVRGQGALGVSVTITPNGPVVDVPQAAEQICRLLDSKTNAEMRLKALKFAKNHLFIRRISDEWEKLLSSPNEPKNFGSPLKMQAKFKPQFSGPKDPSYLRIARLASGYTSKGEKPTTDLYALNPFFDCRNLKILDPLLYEKSIAISQRDHHFLRHLLDSNEDFIRILKKDLRREGIQKLVRLGALIPIASDKSNAVLS